MKRKDGELYYKISEIANLLSICPATLFNYLKVDRQMKENGEAGFLPNPTKINNVQHYKQSQVKELRSGIAKLKRGDLKEYRTKETTCQKLKQENQELKKKLAELEGGEKSEGY
jgi:predicted transcriptional regulator